MHKQTGVEFAYKHAGLYVLPPHHSRQHGLQTSWYKYPLIIEWQCLCTHVLTRSRQPPHKCCQSQHCIIKDLQRLCSLFWQVGVPVTWVAQKLVPRSGVTWTVKQRYHPLHVGQRALHVQKQVSAERMGYTASGSAVAQIWQIKCLRSCTLLDPRNSEACL